MKYRYKVWGAGAFPTDMLRYDQAAIVHEEDRIAANVMGYRTIYTIEGKTKPTIGRWHSFLWHVSDVEVVK